MNSLDGIRWETKSAAFWLRVLLLLPVALAALSATRASADIGFTQSARTVDAYDFVEVTVKANPPEGVNPFTGISVTGSFGPKGALPVSVEAFCDAEDG